MCAPVFHCSALNRHLQGRSVSAPERRMLHGVTIDSKISPVLQRATPLQSKLPSSILLDLEKAVYVFGSVLGASARHPDTSEAAS